VDLALGAITDQGLLEQAALAVVEMQQMVLVDQVHQVKDMLAAQEI
jgi:hypothetical protein